MDTWGFSGPAFLAVYVGLVALTAAAVVADRARADRRGRGAGVGDLDDYDVALLNGEAGLAASVALLALDRAGAVELADRMVRELAESQDLDLGSLTGGTLSEKGLGVVDSTGRGDIDVVSLGPGTGTKDRALVRALTEAIAPSDDDGTVFYYP